MVLGALLFCVIKRQILNDQQRDFAISLVLFIVLLYALAGITTPVIGALVRYKMPALWVMMMLSAGIYKPSNQTSAFNN
jgi:hypothetical protein